MKKNRSGKALPIVGLVALAVLALALSVAAVFQYRGGPAPTPLAVPSGQPSESESAPAEQPTGPSEPTSQPEPPTPEPDPTSESPAPSESEPEASEEPDPDAPSVVVIGDTYSTGDMEESWIGAAAEALGWGEVTNLSSPGRGYMAYPRECDFEPCSNLPGTVATIADLEPDIVVTFAGYADGDYALADAATGYYDALRDALPDAELVALSPVTSGDEAPYWLTLHRQSIQSAVEDVDGVLVDVGQPGVGDGQTLSAEAQQAIGETVIDELSA